MEVIGRIWARLGLMWLAFANAFADVVEEAVFRVVLAYDVLVGRVPIRTDRRWWNRATEAPILVDAFSWTDERLLFSILVWPSLESDLDTALRDQQERLDQILNTLADGAGRRRWSLYWQVDYGLTWDKYGECWVDSEGHSYDGRRMFAYSRQIGYPGEYEGEGGKL